jgi:hypothetical protein
MKFKSYNIDVTKVVTMQGSFMIVAPERADINSIVRKMITDDSSIVTWSVTDSDITDVEITEHKED